MINKYNILLVTSQAYLVFVPLLVKCNTVLLSVIKDLQEDPWRSYSCIPPRSSRFWWDLAALIQFTGNGLASKMLKDPVNDLLKILITSVRILKGLVKLFARIFAYSYRDFCQDLKFIRFLCDPHHKSRLIFSDISSKVLFRVIKLFALLRNYDSSWWSLPIHLWT